MNTPTKISLQRSSKGAQLRVYMAEGFSTVIESVPAGGKREGAALPTLRKQGQAYAKRFNISFSEETL